MQKRVYPDYYTTFRCSADQCPDTCCRGWNIEIDEDVHTRWLNFKHSTDCHLLDHMDTMPLGKSGIRRTIAMDEKQHCPLLTDNGLCSIVLAHGDEMIPEICREFPRQKIDTDTMLQQSVAIRCPEVLDLLWEKDRFSYTTEGKITTEHYPAFDLLDGLLTRGNAAVGLSSDPAGCRVTSSGYLHAVFRSCLQTHLMLKDLVPVDENGYQDYGQEKLDEDNVKMMLGRMDYILKQPDDPDSDETELPDLRICHDMMYEIMREFFHSPVHGKEFTELFYQSQELLRLPEEEQWRLFRSVKLTADLDQKLLLVIEEELFNAVLTIEAEDYETILVRLQWLILQYLVVRYIIYVDSTNNKPISHEQLRHRILHIFRVTDLPDIVKISFFDTQFINWMWTEASPEIELLKHM